MWCILVFEDVRYTEVQIMKLLVPELCIYNNELANVGITVMTVNLAEIFFSRIEREFSNLTLPQKS